MKLTAPDGKKRETDCAEAETLLRLVQSIPNPKAEPLKLWLAKVGYERMQELVYQYFLSCLCGSEQPPERIYGWRLELGFAQLLVWSRR
ncbi:hypothetical protein [Rhodoferax sp.]|uniref:hypothetical protein n=1 Tax=Rhodoferax sp. TaxID=50421 RepID=UPI0025E3C06D|nr:hypothetical protein [Rhodoferax sp.]MCM2341776.1 hypothetical protein [Rhodoferax sp.]